MAATDSAAIIARTARLWARDFADSGAEPTEAEVARYAQGMQAARIVNLTDRQFSRFVRQVAAEVAAIKQERADMALVAPRWGQATLEANGGHSPECEGSCHPSCPIGQASLAEANARAREAQALWAELAQPQPHYPTSAELEAMRGQVALEDERAAYHHLAKARIARGMPWNGRGGLGNAHRADEHERTYGIGASTIGQRAKLIDMRRAVRSGYCLP